MPGNDQIDKTLKYVLQNSPVDVKDLSPDGQRLIQDTRDIIETAREIVQQKNADELFQNFVWHTRDVNVDHAKKDPSEVVPVDKEKAKSDGQQAVKHLRTLLSLVLTNSEVRKLVTDFSVIGRDILARTASKVADKARPDADRLAQVDESAPRDQFVSEGGRLVGPDETPVSTYMRVFYSNISSTIYRSSKRAFLGPTRLLLSTLTRSWAMARRSRKAMAKSRAALRPSTKPRRARMRLSSVRR